MAEYQMNTNQEPPKKKSQRFKYLIYIVVVLVATAISLVISLWGDNFNDAMTAFSQSDWRYVLLTFGVVALTYCIEALILVIFCRLYTRKYRFHQGFACALVGQFYSDVTPGSSGGQVMQVYTMKSQGILVSNGASIMVMFFILYQSALIIFGGVALIFEWNTMIGINPVITLFDYSFTVPMWPLIIIGFVINLSVILILFVMSYSHRLHNFILHYVIGFLGKIHLLKHPDKTRESLRVQVENFKIELRRLQSNIPVLILLFTLFLILIFFRFSVPYFCGLAMHAWGEDTHFVFVSLKNYGNSMVRASFLMAFHQMVTGLIPLPGSAGVAEIFYNAIFTNFFGSSQGVISATQILWRSATFHIVLLISGVVSAFYHSRGGAAPEFASRKTYVTLQLETFDERKRSADTMYETSQFSRKEMQRRLTATFRKKSEEEAGALTTQDPINSHTTDLSSTYMKVGQEPEKEQRRSRRRNTETSPLPIQEEKPKKVKRKKEKKKKDQSEESGWSNWEI